MTDTYLSENISDIILRISYAKSSQGHSASTIIEYFNTATIDQIVEDYFNDLIVENKVSDDYILEQTNIVFEGIGSAIASKLGINLFKKVLPRRIASKLSVGNIVKRAIPAAALTAGTVAILKPDLAKKAVEKVTGTVTKTIDKVKDSTSNLKNLIPDIRPKDSKDTKDSENLKDGEQTTSSISGMSPLSKPEPETISSKQIERERKYNQMKIQSGEYSASKMEAYDIVLDYLMSGGHAETIEEAHYIMMEMTSETIQNIVEGVMPEPIDPTAHKEAQRLARQQGRIRALEAGATTPGEQQAAQSKLKGPQLPGV
jgi:hypothetical protein